MEEFSFVFTVCFMLLGPIKLIPLCAGLTPWSFLLSMNRVLFPYEMIWR